MGEADIGERETLRHSPWPGRIGEIVQVGTHGGAFQMGGRGVGVVCVQASKAANTQGALGFRTP